MALILPIAVAFMPISSAAKELRPAFRRPSGLAGRAELLFGGRAETQSWTRRETLGFETRLRVLREEGFVVMIITGPEGRVVVEVVNGCDAR